MSKHILVIDDETAIRKSFELALEDTAYQVDTASSGEEGVRMHGDSGYDLIFLDLKMPGMNGVEVLRTIREGDSGVPVYIITAFHEEFFEELKALEESGIDFDVMRKPIGSEEIVLVARSVLEGPIGH
jgi:DNA-binding response OmpR family regulator